MSQSVPPHAFARHWLAPSATRGMNLKQRRKLLCLTAASGSVPNIEVAVRAAGCLPSREVFEVAAAAGSLDACQWLHCHGYPMGYDGPLDGGQVLSAAAGGGHMHVCEWLLTLDVRWDWGAEEAAAGGGHVALMECLIKCGPQLRYHRQPEDVNQRKLLAAAVARGCDLPTLQRLWPHWGELRNDDKAEVLAAAAGSPTPDWAAKVEWLEGQGCPRTEEAATKAAARPDALERLTWLRDRGYPLEYEREAVEAAAGSGNIAALQYLLGEGVRPQPWDNQPPIMRAAEGGHLPALQALHAAGWPVHGRHILVVAGRARHLHVVTWLVETLGFALSAELFAIIAESGSVELMAWLRQRGCGWDAAAFTAAARSGCEEALEWLVAQGCPVPEDSGRLYLTACWSGDLATARCLQRLGVPWGDSKELLSHALELARLSMLRCLLEAGCPVDMHAAEAAAAELVSQARRGRWEMGIGAAKAQAAEALGLIRQHLQQQQEQQGERLRQEAHKESGHGPTA